LQHQRRSPKYPYDKLKHNTQRGKLTHCAK
jgi:hypothetical protein